MPRYVLTHRLAGKDTAAARRSSADKLADALRHPVVAGSNLVRHTPAGPSGRAIATVELAHRHAADLRRDAHSDVIVEPEIVHSKPRLHPVEFHEASRQAPAPPTAPPAQVTTRSLRLTVEGDGRPLEGAEAQLLVGKSMQDRMTDPNGRIRFEYDETLVPSLLAVAPAGTFWPMMTKDPVDPVTSRCPPLPPADQRLGWWHRQVGVTRYGLDLGKGILVGVVDTGLAPHPALSHVEDVGSFVEGAHTPDGADIGNHGTYTCGIVAARPGDAAGYGGAAPGAQVYSARAFYTANDATQHDLALAIDYLVHDRSVDLVNLAFGADTSSEVMRDAIQDALSHGALCICAAGNTGGALSYPGALPETVAVSALGWTKWGPPDSLAAARVPAQADRIGDDGLYLANLSAFGAGVDCTAPGVGIIAAMPPRPGLPAPYVALDGTSSSCALVTGALAALLSRHPDYLKAGRDEDRAALARQALVASCRSVGLDAKYQGKGMPRAAL